MSYDSLLSYIEHVGYAALFFALWLGIVGMPIPDEVIVMTGGAVTTNGLLQPVPAFALTYLGVVTGLSLGYFLGRFIGKPVLERIRRKKKMATYIDMSERLVRKYGSFALCIGYFFPIVRHVMPYVVGLNRMSFRRYAAFSYTTGLVWTFLYFTVGRYVGDHVQEVGYSLYNHGLRFIWLPFVLVAVYAIIRLSVKQRRLNRRDAI